jgi:ABC-type transport system involved in cytochrome c biogenesis permease subunit
MRHGMEQVSISMFWLALVAVLVARWRGTGHAPWSDMSIRWRSLAVLFTHFGVNLWVSGLHGCAGV